MSPRLPEVPTPGSVVAGKYWVDRVLGVGGMGMVLAVRHVELGSAFALKVLHAHVLEVPHAAERFLREARAASAIESQHVARVNNFGWLESGTPYILMELLEGENLAQRLGRSKRLPGSTAVDLVLQICEALAEAHAQGIVHRDLKPPNVFLQRRRDGTEIVKVLDFGISKVLAEADVRLTATAAWMGSPHYMSPEQVRNASAVDARTDIWSLGVMLYEATTGRRPFAAEMVAELAVRIANEEPPPMEQVPPEFAAVCLRCLAKDPDRRFQDVGALAAALAPFASPAQRGSVDRIARVLARMPQGRVPSVPPGPAPTPPEPRQSTTGALSSEPSITKTRTRSKAIWALAGGGLVGTGLILSVHALRAPPAPSGAPRGVEDVPITSTIPRATPSHSAADGSPAATTPADRASLPVAPPPTSPRSPRLPTVNAVPTATSPTIQSATPPRATSSAPSPTAPSASASGKDNSNSSVGLGTFD